MFYCTIYFYFKVILYFKWKTLYFAQDILCEVWKSLKEADFMFWLMFVYLRLFLCVYRSLLLEDFFWEEVYEFLVCVLREVLYSAVYNIAKYDNIAKFWESLYCLNIKQKNIENLKISRNLISIGYYIHMLRISIFVKKYLSLHPKQYTYE